MSVEGAEAIGTAAVKLLGESGLTVEAIDVTAALTTGANRQTVLAVVSPGARKVVIQIATRELGLTWIAPVTDEAAIVLAAADTGVPVAPVMGCGYSSILQADVLVTGHIDGETIPRRVLRSLESLEGSADAIARSCGSCLAAIHSIDHETIAFQRPLNVFQPADYLAHLHERLDGLPVPYPTFRFALKVLAENLPSPFDEQGVVHGDFRNGNLIVDDAEIKAVLDWELVHLGDPMEDLAWLCLRTWRFGNDRHEAGGFATVDGLKSAYIEAGGQWRQDAFEWWTMARTVWWGTGLADQAAHYLDGRSSSIVHAASGRRVVELEYDLLNLLAPLVA